MKNSPISNLSKVAMIVAAMILQISCQQDEAYHPITDSAIINLSVSAANSGAATAADDPASAIKSLCILQFKANGNNFGTLRHVGIGTEMGLNSGKYSTTLLQSINNNDKYKLVILANFPSGDYGIFQRMGGKSYAEIQQACLSGELVGSDKVPVFDTSHPFPMFGVVQDGNPLVINETMNLGAVSLVRAVARVDIGVGTKNADNTWNKGNVKFNMTQIQIWKAGKQYAYMPVEGNFSSAAGTLTINNPSSAGTTETKVYGTSYITKGIYCTEKIYLPEADLQWGSVYDANHTNRLAIIVGGKYNGSTSETFYRIDFINDQNSAKMNILRNNVYQFSIKSVTDAGYQTAEQAYNNKPTDIGFSVSLVPWSKGVTASVPSIIGYNMSYGGLNGMVTSFDGRVIPEKQYLWPGSQFLFDYDYFYGEANTFYALLTNPAKRNGWLYETVDKAFEKEGTTHTLMVSGDDVLLSEGEDNEHVPWKTNSALTAFDICRGYSGEGYDGWRLPRLSELALIYGNKSSLESMRGFTKISDAAYWSASEYLEGQTDENKKRSNSAWAINFATGKAEHHSKTDKLKIRCVRSVKGTTSNTLK